MSDISPRIIAKPAQRNLASRVAEIMRTELRLVSVGGEYCSQCDTTVDYSFKIKDGCVERCSEAISKLVFGAMASGDIGVVTKPKIKPSECPHCEYDRRFPGFEGGGWIQQDNNGPIVSCPMCNDDGSHVR